VASTGVSRFPPTHPPCRPDPCRSVSRATCRRVCLGVAGLEAEVGAFCTTRFSLSRALLSSPLPPCPPRMRTVHRGSVYTLKIKRKIMWSVLFSSQLCESWFEVRFVYISICRSGIFFSFCLPLSTSLSVCRYVSLSICLSIYLSTHRRIHTYITHTSHIQMYALHTYAHKNSFNYVPENMNRLKVVWTKRLYCFCEQFRKMLGKLS
jgi:hypothetical protein